MGDETIIFSVLGYKRAVVLRLAVVYQLLKQLSQVVMRLSMPQAAADLWTL